MTDIKDTRYEDSTPDPEFLIKSIAEQGYRLETSLADLIDNSITAEADKIEILIKTDSEPFILYLADNGTGMDDDTLRLNMKFPSTSPERRRMTGDMGRFGLGMKTASFSQTRCFTVLSRIKGTLKYSARTWDVNFLKEAGWLIKVNTQDEIENLLVDYKTLSNEYLQKFQDFQPNTIVIWKGLFKFEQYIEESNRQNSLKKEVTEITSDYLSLVFHRFMERNENPLQIRINNNYITPFNPFPTNQKDFRAIEYKEKNFSNNIIKIEGFILPSRSIDESIEGINIWTTRNRGLMEMEGIYIYRSNRIILFGEWLGVIKKGPRLQLARLRVEVGNNIDHLLHLNVAKSQVVIPHDLTKAFERYIEELKIEAEREFYNRGIRTFSNNKKEEKTQLFERKASNKGVLLELNLDFPLLKTLKSELNKDQLSNLNLVIKMINTRINQIRQTHENKTFTGIEEKDGVSEYDMISAILQLKNSGLSSEQIRKDILPNLGYKDESLPSQIMKILS
jgi:hypothetical protein